MYIMSRSAKVMGFSLPPQTFKQIELLIKKQHKTRSEFMREMIRVYLETSSKVVNSKEALTLSEEDVNKILKLYYQLIQQAPGKTLVVGLAIIDNGKGSVLIGKRKKKDPIKKELTWVFPGGKMESLSFEEELRQAVKEETELDIHVGQLIHARVHPDAQFKPVKIIALYYHCRLIDKFKPQSGGDLAEIKWVPATSIFHYFTTSTADEVIRFLNNL